MRVLFIYVCMCIRIIPKMSGTTGESLCVPASVRHLNYRLSKTKALISGIPTCECIGRTNMSFHPKCVSDWLIALTFVDDNTYIHITYTHINIFYMFRISFQHGKSLTNSGTNGNNVTSRDCYTNKSIHNIPNLYFSTVHNITDILNI